MLRTISLLVAGALIAGCESTGVQGKADYNGDVQAQNHYHGNVYGEKSYGSKPSGEKAYRTYPTADERTASASRTTTVERTTETREQPAAARTEVTTRTETETPAPAPAVKTTETPAPTPTPAHKTTETTENSTPRTTGLPAPTNTYPTGKTASDQLKVTALVDHDGNGLRVANASDKDIRDAKIWLDGSYFARVSSIPTRTTVTVDRKSFVNESGNSPSTLKGVKSIQVQTGDTLYNVQGPVMDDR